MKQSMKLVLQEDLNNRLEKNKNILNLIKSFEDDRVDSESRFSILKIIMENLINDSNTLFERNTAMQIQINELQELILNISKNQRS